MARTSSRGRRIQVRSAALSTGEQTRKSQLTRTHTHRHFFFDSRTYVPTSPRSFCCLVLCDVVDRLFVPTFRPVILLFHRCHTTELEDYLIAHRAEYLVHSARNYTLEQKDYNNRLTAQLIDYAKECGYGHLFEHASLSTPSTPPASSSASDPNDDAIPSGGGGGKRGRKGTSNIPSTSSTSHDDSEFGSFGVVRDRIRCYYKSFVQSSKRREQRRKRNLSKKQCPATLLLKQRDDDGQPQRHHDGADAAVVGQQHTGGCYLLQQRLPSPSSSPCGTALMAENRQQSKEHGAQLEVAL